MNDLVLIIPCSNLKVRNPETKQYLNPEGEVLIKTPYWIRRHLAGEVLIRKPEEKTEKKINK